jgi:hypothetical protein
MILPDDATPGRMEFSERTGHKPCRRGLLNVAAHHVEVVAERSEELVDLLLGDFGNTLGLQFARVSIGESRLFGLSDGRLKRRLPPNDNWTIPTSVRPASEATGNPRQISMERERSAHSLVGMGRK